MMLYPSINDLREKVDSRYTLCILAAKRARDIIDGKPVLTEVESERPVSLATNEIAEALITYRRPDPKEEESEAAAPAEEAAEGSDETEAADDAADAAEEAAETEETEQNADVAEAEEAVGTDSEGTVSE